MQGQWTHSFCRIVLRYHIAGLTIWFIYQTGMGHFSALKRKNYRVRATVVTLKHPRNNRASGCSIYSVSGTLTSFSPRGTFHEHFSTKRVNSCSVPHKPSLKITWTCLIILIIVESSETSRMTWSVVDFGPMIKSLCHDPRRGLTVLETHSCRAVTTTHWDQLSAWLHNSSLRACTIFYSFTILCLPIVGCFLLSWASGDCHKGCKNAKVGHHRSVRRFHILTLTP